MFAIAGGKGGSGKTTAALGLAAALARAGASPLVVDADLDMPDLHVLAGVEPDPSTDDLASGKALERISQPWPALPGVGIVAAGQRETLAPALERAACWHGPVLVDCPGGAGPDAAVPLRACDRSILVSTDGPQALEDAAKTAATARELDAPPIAALVRGSAADLDSHLQCSRIERIPHVDERDVLSSSAFRTFCRRIAKLIRRRAHPPDHPTGVRER